MNSFIGFIKRDKVPLTIAAVVGLIWALLLLNFGDVNFGANGIIFLICIPGVYSIISLILQLLKPKTK